MTYPGGKNGAGVYQRIINHMPPHATYIEPFLGSGAVLRNKRLAVRNIGIDRSKDAIGLCLGLADEIARDLRLLTGDALKLLPALRLLDEGSFFINQPDTLIYADPPYMKATRKAGDMYDFEMDDAGHEELMEIVTTAPCMVMISGYRSPLYDEELAHFHRVDYQTQTRRGMVKESLWMNFKPPVALHDYSHLGEDFRARERIRRKKARWKKKLAKMDRQERLAIMDVLTNADTEIGK